MMVSSRKGVFESVILVVALLAAPAPAADTSPAADRVGFPAGYAASFEAIRVANKTKVTNLGTIYANARAASVKGLGGLPYPDGSIIVMEWAEPLKGEDGALLTDANGLWRKGRVVRVDVMRRERGYGEAYGEKRAGEWEFASYLPDGTRVESAGKPVSCAQCHRKAGVERDYVFQGRFPPLPGN
ncbi:MAG TPA: cytochrome P460 family protein [Lacunisphaera sp.]|nr:cytochrome P460 family protein [Lacunisphaera sp.]